ncbi:GGDEF domain-containing protein [Thalassotalea ponticola]|uniref:GGDEF domain-containing protein n=1 Tax=Thalassotalea ponticola TaxID=1523392 RepID=UPI0025B4CFEA|nr:GGDEF domain-containing protein [Thalassotalea ponticola]MDN3651974.1 GGDEF domain-containing protein [Thalassotalea ponticola]
MTGFLQTSKAFILGCIFIFALHVGAEFSVVQWPQFALSIDSVVPILLVVACLLAAYFKQARLCLLTIIVGSYYALLKTPHPLSEQAVFLYGLATLVWVSLISERGLLSLHMLKQLLFLLLSVGLTHAWLQVTPLLQAKWPMLTAQIVDFYLPVSVAFVVLMTRNVRQAQLAQTAILITATIWCLSATKLITLNWPVTIATICGYYLIAILMNSYFLAYRDELTGLSSRRSLYHHVSTLGSKYSVAMLDIDHFKKFNDTYGHDVGDQVLKLVAAKIAQVKRSGKAFRYGGEEFSLVFAGKKTEQITEELERIRCLIADYEIVIRQADMHKGKRTKTAKAKKVKVTVSMGVATHNKQESFDDTLKRADQALYKAKKNGRNAVVSAT